MAKRLSKGHANVHQNNDQTLKVVFITSTNQVDQEIVKYQPLGHPLIYLTTLF